jgi:hypothetical protein
MSPTESVVRHFTGFQSKFYLLIFTDLQEGINKNSVAINKEVVALRKAAEEEHRMEGRDKRLQETFVSYFSFLLYTFCK